MFEEKFEGSTDIFWISTKKKWCNIIDAVCILRSSLKNGKIATCYQRKNYLNKKNKISVAYWKKFKVNLVDLSHSVFYYPVL